jgi:hypothetical protein
VVLKESASGCWLQELVVEAPRAARMLGQPVAEEDHRREW